MILVISPNLTFCPLSCKFALILYHSVRRLHTLTKSSIIMLDVIEQCRSGSAGVLTDQDQHCFPCLFANTNIHAYNWNLVNYCPASQG